MPQAHGRSSPRQGTLSWNPAHTNVNIHPWAAQRGVFFGCVCTWMGRAMGKRFAVCVNTWMGCDARWPLPRGRGTMHGQDSEGPRDPDNVASPILPAFYPPSSSKQPPLPPPPQPTHLPTSAFVAIAPHPPHPTSPTSCPPSQTPNPQGRPVPSPPAGRCAPSPGSPPPGRSLRDQFFFFC